jgi:hypothetical protein
MIGAVLGLVAELSDTRMMQMILASPAYGCISGSRRPGHSVTAVLE